MKSVISERADLFFEKENGAYLEVLCPIPPISGITPRRAVLILPGGGYHHLCPREGAPIARRFYAEGYGTFVLHYSVLCSTDTLVDEKSGLPKPILEGMAALAYIRRHAERYNIDPEKITVVGFSAGGHLAASLATVWENEQYRTAAGVTAQEVKPNAAVLSYSVGYIEDGWQRQSSFSRLFDGFSDTDSAAKALSPAFQVSRNTCPCFLWHNADDDVVSVKHALLTASALSEKHVPFELHIYPHGGHGVSSALPDALKTPPSAATAHVSAWMEEAFAWLDFCVFPEP